MKRLDWIPVLAALAGYSLISCQTQAPPGSEGGTNASNITTAGDENEESSGEASEEGTSTTSGEAEVADEAESAPRLDVMMNETSSCRTGDLECPNQIDLLFVIDNSGTMAVEQENLARNFPRLIRRLENLTDLNGNVANTDVHIMVTTTDFGNPLCDAFAEEKGAIPAKGAPISTACLEREERFTGLPTPMGESPVEFDACTNVCSNPDAQPEGVPYIWFNPSGDNIPDSVTPTDLDGDDMEDSAVAQALSCIGPQGIDGCGYESPLETMLQALNGDADWNEGDQGFLRPDALLAIAIVTDEADCSIKDYSVLMNEDFQEIDPSDDNMQTSPTSAICWNAGVNCTDEEGDGVYESCVSSDNGMMQPTSRYIGYLQALADSGKDVIMLGILGVPEVTEHNEEPPFQPTAGGVFDLVYRDWIEGEYPDGDILPDEYVADGNVAAEKQYLFGVGPGCTGGDAAGGFTGQAIPPVRIKEVCESLNVEKDDGETEIRCCIESICDDDYSAAIDCLTGIIQTQIPAAG